MTAATVSVAGRTAGAGISKQALALPASFFLFIFIFPFIAGPHYTVLMFSAMGYAIALLGLNLLFGYTGLLSLGHAMFLAIGAYTAGYMTSAGISNLELILLAAAAVGATVAIPIGLLCIRYVKIYFAMLTLAFSMLLYSFLFKFYHLTGGDEGIRIKSPTLTAWDLSSLDTLPALTGPLYYYVLALLVLLTVLMRCLTTSSLGLQLRAIRENQQKAEYLGVDVMHYRLAAFVVAAVYGVLGGVIIAIPVGLADPTIAYWVQSGNLIFMLLLGGYTNFLGPLLGSVVFIFFQDQLMSFTEYWRLTFGVILVVIVIFFPNGLMAAFDRRGWWST
jgi:branched-chain amino acid transport system permease protein